jgi:Tfp pilus assembly pilus retraction ATPase PilT
MITIEAFASEPPCSGGRLLLKLIDRIRPEYEGKAEIIVYRGVNEKTKEYGLQVTPAIVIDKDIRIIGVCPSEETLRNALFEAGL